MLQATRIAAIFAGSSATAADALGYGNAVSAISKITAKVIGADVNGNGQFGFIEGSGGATRFEPDTAHDPTDGDTALDGLILALASGYQASTVSITPTPGFLIEV